MNETTENSYEDIIGLPHPRSVSHPRMPVADRAAQFAPFAALTGHDATIREAARLTDQLPELDESAKAELDDKLRDLLGRIPERPEAVFTYFVPDSQKAGGALVSESGILKKSDPATQTIILSSGTVIPLDALCNISEPASE